MKRGLFIAGSLAGVTGCSAQTNALNNNPVVQRILGSASVVNHAVIGTHGRARLYGASEITADFPSNGNPTPQDGAYTRLVQAKYAGYRLPVDGLVERSQTFDLRQLRALASIDEITRHDCVEGWSVVGRWAGVRLSRLLAIVRPTAAARYIVFHSFDTDSQGTPFYGSIGIHEAAAPQTQLALDFNGKPVAPEYGGPVRLRIPTQLAYKSTKWVKSIQVVASYADIGDGKGGYWEDNGYAWYAGI